MDEGIGVDEANERQHFRWTVLPKVPTDLLAAELASREGVYSRLLEDGERMEIHGPYNVMLIR